MGNGQHHNWRFDTNSKTNNLHGHARNGRKFVLQRNFRVTVLNLWISPARNSHIYIAASLTVWPVTFENLSLFKNEQNCHDARGKPWSKCETSTWKTTKFVLVIQGTPHLVFSAIVVCRWVSIVLKNEDFQRSEQIYQFRVIRAARVRKVPCTLWCRRININVVSIPNNENSIFGQGILFLVRVALKR